MNEGIKGSQLIPVEKAGHGFYYEQRGKSQLRTCALYWLDHFLTQ